MFYSISFFPRKAVPWKRLPRTWFPKHYNLTCSILWLTLPYMDYISYAVTLCLMWLSALVQGECHCKSKKIKVSSEARELIVASKTSLSLALFCFCCILKIMLITFVCCIAPLWGWSHLVFSRPVKIVLVQQWKTLNREFNYFITYVDIFIIYQVGVSALLGSRFGQER